MGSNFEGRSEIRQGEPLSRVKMEFSVVLLPWLSCGFFEIGGILRA